MKFVFILNPAAGGAFARRRRSRLVETLRSSGLDYEIASTEGPRHALRLARSAAEAGSAVIAVGGDGTAHEVASGIIESGANVPMAVLPTGTGNDFAKMLDVPRSDGATVRLLAEGRSERIDYGRVSWAGPSGSGTGYFINICGTGFDAKVAAAASDFKWLAGTPRYVASVLRTLRRWKAPTVEIVLSTDEESVYSFRGPLFLAMAGNGRCSGGGFYLTPRASIVDGRIDVCVIRDVSVRRVLSLMPRALKGRHVGAPEVSIEKVGRMVIAAANPLPIQADGEILTDRATEIEITVVPGGIRMLLPVKR